MKSINIPGRVRSVFLDVAKKKLGKLQQLLSAAKQQMDDPEDVTRIQAEMAEVQKQIDTLKAS